MLWHLRPGVQEAEWGRVVTPRLSAAGGALGRSLPLRARAVSEAGWGPRPSLPGFPAPPGTVLTPGMLTGSRAAGRGGAGPSHPHPPRGFQVCSSYLLQQGMDSGEILARLGASACQVGAPGPGDEGAL